MPFRETAHLLATVYIEYLRTRPGNISLSSCKSFTPTSLLTFACSPHFLILAFAAPHPILDFEAPLPLFFLLSKLQINPVFSVHVAHGAAYVEGMTYTVCRPNRGRGGTRVILDNDSPGCLASDFTDTVRR